MKSRIAVSMVLLVTLALLVGCAKAPIVKPQITKPIESEPKKVPVLVEVVDFKMEKIEESLYGPDYGTIKITGTAIYHGTKKYDDEIAFIVFGLYDEKGNQVRRFEVPSFSCGESKNPKNIVPGKPFPFEHQDEEIKKDRWEVITEARFEKVTKL